MEDFRNCTMQEKQEIERLPLQERRVEVLINNVSRRVPAFHRNWVAQDRIFSLYVQHPIQENGKFVLGAKESWLELVKYVQEDFKWLLRLNHYKFWSYMVHCRGASDLIISFLQEAPPSYMRGLFPKDESMRKALEETERVALLVFHRLSTEMESSSRYISNFGDFIYDHLIFTAPMLLDICSIFGSNYKDHVIKIVHKVLSADIRFMDDFEEVVSHIVSVFNLMKLKFQVEEGCPTKLADKIDLKAKEIKDLVLHYFDSVATIKSFLDIYSKGSILFSNTYFIGALASFYGTVIPKIYATAKEKNCELLETWKTLEFIKNSRLEILKILKHVVTYIINEAMENSDKRSQLVEDYLGIITEVLSEPLFVLDYQTLYPIDVEIDLLTQIHPEIDLVKVNFILEGIASCIDMPELQLLEPPKKNDDSYCNNVYGENDGACAFTPQATGVELASLITEVKDILPHLGDGFIEKCLKYYNFNSEKAIAAILENTLPPTIEEGEWSATQISSKNAPPSKLEDFDGLDERSGYRGKKKSKYKNLNEMLDDKEEINQLRDMYSELSIVYDDDYEDEYDDTYDSNDVTVREPFEPERERSSFVVPRVLRVKEESEESEEEEEEQIGNGSERNRDHFVQNPAEIRERYERQRNERARRDLVGKPKGQGQDKQVLANRDFKGAHKSFTANHNRRKQASRKRNQGMIPS